MRRYTLLGAMMAAAGALCFSSTSIFVKLIYQITPVEPIGLLALRMLCSLPVFFAVLLWQYQKGLWVRLHPYQWGAMAGVGCLGYYISSWFDFVGLQYVSAGIERLIVFIYPTLVILFSAVLFKERIYPKQWVAMGLVYLGLVVAFFGEAYEGVRFDVSFFIGCTFVFLCSVSFAFYMVGSGRLMNWVSSIQFTTYSMIFASVGVLIHCVVAAPSSFLHLPANVYYMAAAMALLSTAFPVYLRSEGVYRIGPGNAAIIAALGPLATLWLANWFLAEPIDTLQVVGTIFIVVGIGWLGRGGYTARNQQS